MRNERNIETGKRLKEALKLRGMKQNELADTVHLTPVTINNICSGRAALTLGNAHEFAELLNIDYKYLTLESDYLTESDAYSKHLDDMEANLKKERILRKKISSILKDSDYAFKNVQEITGKESAWMAYTLPDGSRRFCKHSEFDGLIDDIAWFITSSSQRFVESQNRTFENFKAKMQQRYGNADWLPDELPLRPPHSHNDPKPEEPFEFV